MIERFSPGKLGDFRPYEELPDITHPDWDCEPLIMWQEGFQGQRLCFTAVNHSSDPGDHNVHYRAVNGSFKEFSILTADKNRAIVVEGGLRRPAATAEESYKDGGEACLAAYWAARQEIEQRCYEPPGQGKDYLLSQGFLPEEIATFLFARLVPSWYRRVLAGRSMSFEDFAAARLYGGGNIAPSLAEFGFTYKQLKGFYETLYGFEFTPQSPATVQFLTEETTGYMLPRRSRLHEIAITTNRLRDIELAKGILSLWQQGTSVFVAFGYSHGLTLQPFIETLGSNAETGEH